MSGLFDDDDDYLEYLYLTGDEDDRDELETWFGKAEADAIICENTGRSKYDDEEADYDKGNSSQEPSKLTDHNISAIVFLIAVLIVVVVWLIPIVLIYNWLF